MGRESKHARGSRSPCHPDIYFVGEATFARHRDKYIKTGGEFVSDDDSVGSRARLSGPLPSPPRTPVITFPCLLSRPARRSQRKKHGDRSAANIHLLSSNTCCFWPPIVIHLVAANRLPLNQTRPSVRDSAAQLANT